WQLREHDGLYRKFETSKDLWDACVGYFEWVEKNPWISEEKGFASEHAPETLAMPKLRAMTIIGMCIHIGISQDTWETYRKHDDLHGVTSVVDGIIYEQKLTGAAAGMLNANIISRELGLKESTETNHKGSIGVYGELNPEELDAEVARKLQILEQSKQED
ncbi:MAG: terminase small subunit, partial [Flavobacteriales bacterium]